VSFQLHPNNFLLLQHIYNCFCNIIVPTLVYSIEALLAAPLLQLCNIILIYTIVVTPSSPNVATMYPSINLRHCCYSQQSKCCNFVTFNRSMPLLLLLAFCLLHILQQPITVVIAMSCPCNCLHHVIPRMTGMLLHHY
jgi:hypothetical protein